MYSESDFENFSKKLISSAEERAQKIVSEAKAAAEEKVKAAEEEAAKSESEALQVLKKELRSFEEEQKAKAESDSIREWHRFLSDLKAEVTKEIEEEIESRFEEIAQVFLKWIETKFPDGELQIYEGVRTDGLEAYKVVKTADKKVVFSKENAIIELTPASLIEEYSWLVEKEIAKRIGA